MNTDHLQSEQTENCIVANGCVLVVDDEPVLLEAYSEILQGERLLVKTARNSQEACNLLNENDVSLVILDWDLRGSGGILDGGCLVLKACRRKDPYLPVIVISGHIKEVEIPALMSGADQFFAKPIDFAVLLPLVRRWMQRAQALKQSIIPRTVGDILSLEEVERRYVTAVVDLLEGNASLAAQMLDVNRHTVTSKMKRELSKEDSAEHRAVEGGTPP